MKKFLLIISALLIIHPAMAKNVKVEALSDFSTANPPSYWSVRVAEGFVVNSGYVVPAGAVIEGKIENVTSPKRLKRAASFTFVPQKYYDSQIGTQPVTTPIEGKYSALTGVTPMSVAKTGAVTAGNMFVSSFIGPGVALVEGAVKNEEGNRAKSAAVSVYESSPLSYINKGKELEFKKGQIFIMSFKLKDEEEETATEAENKPNYTYEIENK